MYKGNPRTCAIFIQASGSNWGLWVFPVIKITVVWQVHEQAIDIILQVWEHAQKSKIFLPNKACFLIVFNFLNKK